MATAEQILDELHRIRETNHEKNQGLSVSDRLRILHERVTSIKAEFHFDLPLAGASSSDLHPSEVDLRSDQKPATRVASQPKRASGGNAR